MKCKPMIQQKFRNAIICSGICKKPRVKGDIVVLCRVSGGRPEVTTYKPCEAMLEAGILAMVGAIAVRKVQKKKKKKCPHRFSNTRKNKETASLNTRVNKKLWEQDEET